MRVIIPAIIDQTGRKSTNAWRPHHGLGQRAPSGSAPTAPPNPTDRIIAQPVLGGLHHVYQHAA
jgi:hypothetical protein